MERDPDRIESRAPDQLNVLSGDVGVAPLSPKLVGCVRSDQLTKQRVDLPCRLRTVLEPEHVALGNQPVPEIDPAQHERLAVAADHNLSALMHERRLSSEAEGESRCKEELHMHTIEQ